MNVFRSIIEGAVNSAIAEHPKYFTPRGAEKAQAAIIRKIMAALREDDASDEVAPTIEQSFVIAEADSLEARAFVNLRKIAGANEPRRTGDGKTIVKREAHCAAVFALADLPPQDDWLFLTAPHQIRAWMDFFRDMLGETGRRSIAQTRGTQTGIFMPYPFPPSKIGKIYDQNEPDEDSNVVPAEDE